MRQPLMRQELMQQPMMRQFIQVCWLLALLQGCLHYAVAAGRPVATVQAVNGQLTVRRRGAANYVASAARTALYTGDIVRTGARSRASLLFRDGAQARLNANAAIEITPPRPVAAGKRSLFRVITGEVWARLRFGNAVETRAAIAGVRGTEINLLVREDDSVVLTVVEGEVDFFNPQGHVTVAASQQSTARPGTAPTAPVTLATGAFVIEWMADLNRVALPREKFFVSIDRDVLNTELAARQKRVVAAPRDAGARRDYADVLFDLGRFEPALSEYSEVLRLAPTDAGARLGLGYALLELGRVDEAETAFRALADTQPEQLGLAQVALAQVALVRGDAAGAADLASRVVAASGADIQNRLAEANILLGLALMRQPDRLPAAIEAFTAATGAQPENVRYQAYAWLALSTLLQDLPERALAEARAAVRMAPASSLAHAALAQVYFATDRAVDAQREARLAANLNPQSVAARVVLAQSVLLNGDLNEAGNLAAQAVALDPQLPQARYLLGVTLALNRDYTHAARELQQCLRLAPDFLPAASALAQVYNAMGRGQEAVAVLADLEPRHARSDAVPGALGEVYYEQGRYDLAVEQYRQAIEANPGSALHHAGLTRALLYSNRLREAISSAQRAVALAPTVGRYHALLGLAYEYSGLRSQAEREFREALTREPRNALALAQLAFRHEGSDLRPAAASFTQAFLLDPAVARDLLRGGISTEISPRAGNRGTRDLELINRVQDNDGRINSFASVVHDENDIERSSQRRRFWDVSEHLTVVANPRSNLYFALRGQSDKSGLPGPVTAPDDDDNGVLHYGQATIAARQRLHGGGYLWAGLFANTSRQTTRDPDLDSFSDNSTGLPVARQRFTSTAWQPELRVDLPVGGAALAPARRGLLTLGMAHARTDFDSRRDLVAAVPGFAAGARFEERDRSTLAYAQWEQRPSERLSFIGQLRVQRLTQAKAASITVPGGTGAAADWQRRTRVLPGLLATFQANRQTTLRVSYAQRVTDITTSTLAPMETLLRTESSALPRGTPDTMRLAQVDVERYLAPDRYAKVFVWRTTADNVRLGGSDLLGFGNGLLAVNAPSLTINGWRGSGLGARYEQRIHRYIFANVGVFARRTRTEAGGVLGFPFYGANAPYEPRRGATMGLNYVDPAGNKLALSLRHTGAFFADSPLVLGRQRFPARTYVDLLLAREPSVHNEIFVRVLNLFNQQQIQFSGFPTGERRFEVGATRRF